MFIPVDSENLAKKIAKRAFEPVRTPRKLFSDPKVLTETVRDLNPNPSYRDNVEMIASYAGVPAYVMDETFRPPHSHRNYLVPVQMPYLPRTKPSRSRRAYAFYPPFNYPFFF